MQFHLIGQSFEAPSIVTGNGAHLWWGDGSDDWEWHQHFSAENMRGHAMLDLVGGFNPSEKN